LVIPVGKLAISQFIPVQRLNDVVGGIYQVDVPADLVPLPHPSGASTWHRTEPGKTLLKQALALIAKHAAWQEVCRNS
jgi:uracil-DNA glycosylase